MYRSFKSCRELNQQSRLACLGHSGGSTRSAALLSSFRGSKRVAGLRICPSTWGAMTAMTAMNWYELIWQGGSDPCSLRLRAKLLEWRTLAAMPTAGKHRKTTCVHSSAAWPSPVLWVQKFTLQSLREDWLLSLPSDYGWRWLKVIKPRMPIHIIPLTDLVFSRDKSMEQSVLLLDVRSCLNALFVSSQLHLPPSLHLCLLLPKGSENNQKSIREYIKIYKNIWMYVRSLWSLWLWSLSEDWSFSDSSDGQHQPLPCSRLYFRLGCLGRHHIGSSISKTDKLECQAQGKTCPRRTSTRDSRDKWILE